MRDLFAIIEDGFFNQYSWRPSDLNTCAVAEILGWYKAIRRRKKTEMKQELLKLELLTYAVHTTEPAKFGEGIQTMIKNIDEEDSVDGPKVNHEGYYPSEDTDLNQIDRLKGMRQYHGLQ